MHYWLPCYLFYFLNLKQKNLKYNFSLSFYGNKRKINFQGVSEIVGTEDMGLLILTDENNMRQISIVCDKAMAVQLELRTKDIPIVNIMLPEVLCRMQGINPDSGYELLIDDLVEGQYRTTLYDKKNKKG